MSKWGDIALRVAAQNPDVETVGTTPAVDMRKRPEHKAMERQKYNAQPTEVDDLRFDSKAEAKRYVELLAMERAGLITDLQLQPVYKLFDKFTDKFGRQHRAAAYIGDFAYSQNGQVICEDVKGHPTPLFALKWKLAIRAYPDVRFEVVK